MRTTIQYFYLIASISCACINVTYSMEGPSQPSGQSYSVADYIRQHGQPEIVVEDDGTHVLNLCGKRLMSLDGLDCVVNKDTVQVIYLNNNKIITISPHAFKGFINLQLLQISGNPLTIIQSDAFNGLGSLRRLHLMGNQIVTIQTGAFNGVGNLRQLHLNGNQLAQLQVGMLKPLGNLEELLLSGNKLTVIPSGAFNGLSNVEELNLAENPLKTVQPRACGSLVNLQQLKIDDESLFNKVMSQVKLQSSTPQSSICRNTVMPLVLNLTLTYVLLYLKG